MTLPLEMTIPPAGSMRGMITESIIELLQPLHTRQGGYVEGIFHWRGETLDQLREQTRGARPAILVVAHTGDLEGQRGSRRDHGRKKLRVEVFVVSTHFGGHDARLTGTQNKNAAGSGITGGTGRQDPGSYQILDDVEALLYGRDTEVLGASYLIPRQELLEDESDEYCIWRMVYSIDVSAPNTLNLVDPTNPANTLSVRLASILQRHTHQGDDFGEGDQLLTSFETTL